MVSLDKAMLAFVLLHFVFQDHTCLLLSPLEICTTDCPFCFSPVVSFFLELLVIVLHSAPVAYWTVLNLDGGFIFQHHIFLPFHTVHLISRQKSWNELPFPPPVGHILSELFTMTCPSWVASTELQKPFHHDKAVIHDWG